MFKQKYLLGLTTSQGKRRIKTSFYAILSVLLIIFLNKHVLATDVSGDVSGVWTKASSPYVVTGDIRISDGDTLIIEPGAQVAFQKGTFGYEFNIKGTLIARGTVAEYITITSQESTPSNGDWRGINVTECDSGTVLSIAISVMEEMGMV